MTQLRGHGRGRSAARLGRGAVVRTRSMVGYSSRGSILVTGAGRSGTTWVGDTVASMAGAAMLFEPEHRTKGRASAAHACSVDARIEIYRRLARGKYANNWAVRDLRSFALGRRLVVKSVVATDLAPLLARQAIFGSVIAVVRHPCAVIASRLEADFFAVPDMGSPAIVRAVEHNPMLRRIAEQPSDATRYALEWAGMHLALSAERSSCLIVPYETMVIDPQVALTAIRAEIGGRSLETHDVAGGASFTTRAGSLRSGLDQIGKWREVLSDDDVNDILTVVRAAGVAFYDETVWPVERLFASAPADQPCPTGP